VKARDAQDDWVRSYGNTDVDAWVSGGHVYFESALGKDELHDLGTVSAWEATPPRIICGRGENGMFFVRLRTP
jgi:hypothetical protein